ncbi:vomeronasal type-2 receptor 26-like [Gastrophryne carolinensis]
MKLLYADPDRASTADSKLRNLRQAKRSAEEYSAEFQQWATDSKWNDPALCSQFRIGLSESIKDALGFPTIGTSSSRGSGTGGNQDPFSWYLTSLKTVPNHLFLNFTSTKLLQKTFPFVSNPMGNAGAGAAGYLWQQNPVQPGCSMKVCVQKAAPTATSLVRLEFLRPIAKKYADLLTFTFMVKAFNREKILPNMTVGSFICDNCGDATQTVYNILQTLSGYKKEAPNYSCSNQGEVIGFVGSNVAMAELIRTFGYSQISYGALDPVSNIHNTKSYFNIAHSNLDLKALASFFHAFGWNWIGIVMISDDRAESKLREVTQMFNMNGICIAYVIKLCAEVERNQEKNKNVIQKSSARAILFFGNILDASLHWFILDFIPTNFTLIIHESWISDFVLARDFLRIVNGSFILTSSTRPIPGLITALYNMSRSNQGKDPILENIYYYYFGCTDIDPSRKKLFKLYHPLPERACPDNKYKLGHILSDIHFPSYYYVNRAITILVNAVHLIQIQEPPSAHRYRNKGHQSRCSPSCSPGYRKVPNNHIHFCCYDCAPCSEGEVSNETDSGNCKRCPNEEWPDEKKVKCIPKTFEFLSYEEDILTPSIAAFSLVGSVITALVLIVFISFWDSPVVKANNRTVSIILLTSILLSFLCVFLFLGRPVDITCMLRQVSFGIFFTISVSCVLAKTIIVCIAFKVTKPNSYWSKWVGMKMGIYVVLICSSSQVLVCVIWLSVSPPYQEYDMFSHLGKIIIQCNEGSVTGFYSVLGYMGFLAAVSFVLAFMVRTLPDSFNEAKYITFSMLVFCSVWIAMVPAYLSTRGKYMVAVEIFAILTSCAGLLGCIFSPKLYIIVIKPERNSRLRIKQNIK